jgi:hypothetical protein
MPSRPAGKKAGKTAGTDNNIKKNQGYNHNDKNAGNFPPPLRELLKPGQPNLPGCHEQNF